MNRVVTLGIVSMLFLVLACSFSPHSTVQARTYLFTTESSLNLSANPSDLGTLLPLDTVKVSTVSFTYNYGRFARPIGFPFPNRKTPTNISVSIVSLPTWCSATLSKTTFEVPIQGFFQPGQSGYTFTLSTQIISSSAPAFQQGIITIGAVAEQNGNINPASALINISLEPAFLPSISVSASNSSLELQSSEEKNVTITVKNTGNANIIAEITPNSNASIEITSLSVEKEIAKGTQESFSFSIKNNETTIKKIKQDQLKFTVSYYAVLDQTKSGTPLDVIVTLELYPSKDDEGKVDLTPFVIGIVIVFIILYLIFTLLIRKR